ncbi:hypothetical protein [Streptomyces aureus]|uniref:hypothetical protein n=1 Tax=Streptomyces aureus TaxID=193461 RepID=UPI0033D0B313
MSADDGSVDELFARLPEDGRRALEQVGMGLPVLRRMAARDGMPKVRAVLSEFSSRSWLRRPGDDEGPGERTAVRPWVLLALAAVAGVVLTELCTLALGETALLVGAVWGICVLFAAFRTRASHGGLALRWITVAAYVVLVLVGSFGTQRWYLRLYGAEQPVTIVQPLHQWTHGTRETYCRVRLEDGSVRQVLDDSAGCADRVGRTTTAVVDPAGRYRPFLGTTAGLGGTPEAAVALCAAAVLLLAPAGAVALGRARGRRPVRWAPRPS